MTCELYLITPPAVPDVSAFVGRLRPVLETGAVAALQLRLKDVDDDEILTVAAAIRPLCHDNDVALLINDRADLAAKAGADGVHLGQQDGTVAEARALLGGEASIGVTCHNSRDLAVAAGAAGADYVAFGAFFATQTKTVVHQASPEILRWAQDFLTIPCVAIGGIMPDSAAPLVAAGADFLAVSGAVWQSENPIEVIQNFQRVMQNEGGHDQ